MKAFENKMLRKISGPKWDEVGLIGNGRKCNT
jgi:hypothetical protein